eukprot:CAMPEP_0175445778 /NCGR_PEP_ID=MMETSP0095-20121207/59925_1 /TAXON_ID=311494 /ORGANISM="Alexandrium monilatum, Strain CCMP3105" /LENGTH=66 /DNA_ID=CAMNT_0016746021 /DNA_START=69 /DNA_END=266 /DNA_ORIENTATION=+
MSEQAWISRCSALSRAGVMSSFVDLERDQAMHTACSHVVSLVGETTSSVLQILRPGSSDTLSDVWR